MTPLQAKMLLDCHVNGWRIDTGEPYGMHHPIGVEVKQAASVLRALPGAPRRFSNYRQLASWAGGDGFEAVLDFVGAAE